MTISIKMKKCFLFTLVAINSASLYADNSWLSSLGSTMKNAGASLYKNIARFAFYKNNQSSFYNKNKEKIAKAAAIACGTGIATWAGWYYFFKKPALERIKNELHPLELERIKNELHPLEIEWENRCLLHANLKLYKERLQQKLDILVPPLYNRMMLGNGNTIANNNQAMTKYEQDVKANPKASEYYNEIETIGEKMLTLQSGEDETRKKLLDYRYQLDPKNYRNLDNPFTLKEKSFYVEVKETLKSSRQTSTKLHQAELQRLKEELQDYNNATSELRNISLYDKEENDENSSVVIKIIR